MRGGLREKGQWLAPRFRSVGHGRGIEPSGRRKPGEARVADRRVTLVAATDWQDAEIPEPEPEVERPKANRQRDWLTGTRQSDLARKRQHSYLRGETFEGEIP
jgi:hypothetical protein